MFQDLSKPHTLPYEMEISIYFTKLSYLVWYLGIFKTLKEVSASARTLFGVFARKATVNFSLMIGREGQPVHGCWSPPPPPRVSLSFEPS